MSKIKKIISSVMAAAVLAVGTLCINASAYATSSSWALHYYVRDSNVSQDLTLVAYGNGYKGYISSKSGDCSTNYVTISAPNMSSKTITEVGATYAVSLKPSSIANDYVIFTVRLTYGSGEQAYNGGTITI